MHFFRSREEAGKWVEGREAVVALSLGEAFELAQVHWVKRLRQVEI
jgi:hypothetical protein